MSWGQNLADHGQTQDREWHESVTATQRQSPTETAADRAAFVKNYVCIASCYATVPCPVHNC